MAPQHNDHRLQKKTALITGAGSGIGRAAAVAFAAAGAQVAVVDIDEKAARSVSEEIASAGGRSLPLVADISRADDIFAAMSAVVEEFGGLDVLYNNAGIYAGGDVLNTAEAEWDRIFAVNARGTFLCCKFAVPHLEAAGGGGSIINQASVSALVGVKELVTYSASKGAIVSLTRALAVDLAPRGIRVNCICPGTVRTPMIEQLLAGRGGGDSELGLKLTTEKYPLGRLGLPQDVAGLALFLASEDASWITGGCFPIDGGMTAQ